MCKVQRDIIIAVEGTPLDDRELWGPILEAVAECCPFWQPPGVEVTGTA
jgi:hypothetical protein